MGIIFRENLSRPLTWIEQDNNNRYSYEWLANTAYLEGMVVLYNNGTGYAYYRAKFDIVAIPTFNPTQWDRIGDVPNLGINSRTQTFIIDSGNSVQPPFQLDHKALSVISVEVNGDDRLETYDWIYIDSLNQVDWVSTLYPLVDTYTVSIKYLFQDPTINPSTGLVNQVEWDNVLNKKNATQIERGIVELATQLEFDNGTDIGDTGASLVVVPSMIKAKLDTKLDSVSPGTGISIDYTNPLNPVISVSGSTLSFTNGLTETVISGVVKLGGALIENTAITASANIFTIDGSRLIIGNVTGAGSILSLYDNNVALNGLYGYIEFNATRTALQSEGYLLETTNSTDNTVLALNSGDFTISDFRVTKKGLEYGADYSIAFTNRSLVDKEWVEAQESLLIGNVVGANTIAFTNAYLSGNYTVKQAIDAIAAPLTFTAGSVPFAGATGALTQDNANLFFDDTNDILRARNISIGTQTSTAYGLYMRTDTVIGNPMLIEDASGGVYTMIDSTNKYVQIGTGDTNTPHLFRFVGSNSTPPTNNDSFSSIHILNLNNVDTEGAGFIAQHGESINLQRLRITHHTDYSGVNPYLSRSAHFTLDRNGGSGDYTTNKFVFSASNFTNTPNPSTDTFEYHTYRIDDASIGANTKRFVLDGNGTLALYNAYTVVPYSASIPTSTEADSFKMFAKDYNGVNGKSSPYFLLEDLKTISIRRGWQRDLKLEFYPSYETDLDVQFSGPVEFIKIIFDTDWISSINLSYRLNSLGPNGAFTPVGSLALLNAFTTTVFPTDFYTVKFTAVFTLLLNTTPTQTIATLIYEPENNI